MHADFTWRLQLTDATGSARHELCTTWSSASELRSNMACCHTGAPTFHTALNRRIDSSSEYMHPALDPQSDNIKKGFAAKKDPRRATANRRFVSYAATAITSTAILAPCTGNGEALTTERAGAD